MARKRKIGSIDDICRVCLCDEGCMSDIFSQDLRAKIDDLQKSTSIPIEDDDTFPRNICHVCLYKLDMWVDFKKQFICSNAILRGHLEIADNKAPLAKRKHSELRVCAEDNSTDQGDAKKLKSNTTLTSMDSIGSNVKTTKQSNLKDERVTIGSSQKEALDTVKSAEVKLTSQEAADNVKSSKVKLTSQEAPDNVKSGKVKLTSQEISDNIKSVHVKLTLLDAPDNVKFSKVKHTSQDAPDNVKSAKAKITSQDAPDNVKSAKMKFSPQETSDNVKSAKVKLASQDAPDNVKSLKMKTALQDTPDKIKSAKVKLTSQEVPDNVKSAVVKLTSLEMPDNVKSAVVKLTSLEAPDNIKSPKVKLTSQEAPDNNKSAKVKLTSQEIPDKVKLTLQGTPDNVKSTKVKLTSQETLDKVKLTSQGTPDNVKSGKVKLTSQETPDKVKLTSEETPDKVKLTLQETPDNVKSAKVKFTPQNAPENVKVKEGSQITTDVIQGASTVSPKVKQIVGRRAKTTERRKESTRRWVARKKALLAATGDNDTDTDSMGSDDDQLSPVQKARAKCNAEKVGETQRRVTRALKNVDGNVSGQFGTNANIDSYVIHDSGSEMRKDTMNCTIKTETSIDGRGDARLTSNNVAVAIPSHPINSTIENLRNSSNIMNIFVPHSVRSELVVDDATFVVTSTLVLSEPHYLNPTQPNISALPTDEANQERNTDIIDAVQLRRVTPANVQLKNDNKLIDTCLNIEVEGTELEALQRVQSELASFVEKDMKDKLADDNTQTEKVDNKVKDNYQTLDQQLKTIVEKTIKKNLKNSKAIENRGKNTFTGEFLKAALRSKIFQPRVLLVRHDQDRLDAASRKSKKRKPNDVQEARKNTTKFTDKKIEELPAPLGKRRSVQPAKYADYSTSLLHSEKGEVIVTEVVKKPPLVSKPSKAKSYSPALMKLELTPVVNEPRDSPLPILPNPAIDQGKPLPILPKPTVDKKPNVTTIVPVPVVNNSTVEKHICGYCGDSFDTRAEVEIHFGSHKKQKQKMMRCKRCHEIVEARYVKSHVCNALNNLHKCNTCDATFRTEQFLARHEETHDFAKGRKIDNTSRDETTMTTTTSTSTSTTQEIVDYSNEQNVSDIAVEDRNCYTCFVCDKTFTDEEILKDHLQKHCDDVSEEEHNKEKEYQCAICGESLNSEDALEIHVEKHLFDDEDDNPNLISIADAEINKSMRSETIHDCSQCSENFDSEMLLMLHMQAHEEEVAIAEWERRGIDNSQEEQHICVICDDLFATEDELSEHLDVHNGNAHICLLCEKPFLTLEELQNHVNTH